MANFDDLNRQTREHNSRLHSGSPTMQSSSSRRVSADWLNRYNNETYKANNGAYSPKYY